MLDPLVKGEPFLSTGDKTPAWKSLRSGDSWLFIGMVIEVEIGEFFPHNFPGGDRARFKIIDRDTKNNVMCEFIEWIVGDNHVGTFGSI